MEAWFRFGQEGCRLLVAATFVAAVAGCSGAESRGEEPAVLSEGLNAPTFVWSERQKLVASDGADGEQFGSDVALSGDTAAISSSLDASGSVSMFVRSGNTWTLQQKLDAGYIVAISGDTAVIGVPDADTGGNREQGLAAVYVRSGNVWTFQAQLDAEDGAALDRFGLSVAIDGDTIAVGAPYDDLVGNNTVPGSAYIFVRSGTTWTQQAKLIRTNYQLHDQLGVAIAVSGDTVVVGAYPIRDLGLATIFVRSGTTWSEQQTIRASDGTVDNRYGSAVAVDGNTVVVGAEYAEVGTAVNQGAAYAYVRNGTTWTEQQKVVDPDGVAGAIALGRGLSIQGDRIVAGAPFVNGAAGKVILFTRSGSQWSRETTVVASDLHGDALFGIAVDLDGDTIVAGAPDFRRLGPGAAYVFHHGIQGTGGGGMGGVGGSGAGTSGGGNGGAAGAAGTSGAGRAGSGGAAGAAGTSGAGRAGSGGVAGAVGTSGAGPAGSGGTGDPGGGGEGGEGGGDSGSDAGGVSGSGGSDAGTSAGGMSSAGSSGAPASGGSVAGDGSQPGSTSKPTETSGCGCRILRAEARHLTAPWLVALVLVALRRRQSACIRRADHPLSNTMR
jgi:hypothetical protein